jgi:hypothetical protein
VAASGDDLDAVVRAWTAGAPGNGFSVSLAGLSSKDWREVLRALLLVDGVAQIPQEEQKQP